MNLKAWSFFVAIAAPLFVVNAEHAQDAQPELAIDHITMRLFYEQNGTLSPDISPPAQFVGWNTVIGEGDSGGAADAILVTVALRTQGHRFIEGRPLLIEAQAGNRRIAHTHATSHLTSLEGWIFVPLWIENVGCVGRLTVTAMLGDQRREESIDLNCGE